MVLRKKYNTKVIYHCKMHHLLCANILNNSDLSETTLFLFKNTYLRIEIAVEMQRSFAPQEQSFSDIGLCKDFA